MWDYRKYDIEIIDKDFIEDMKSYIEYEFVEKDILEEILNSIEVEINDILDLFKDYNFKQAKENLEELAERLY